MAGAHAFEVQTLFRGVVIGTKEVVRPRRRTRRRQTRRAARRATFVIGSTSMADAPVAPEYLEQEATHTLLTAPHDHDDDDDDRYTVHVTPRMTGVVVTGDRTETLPDVVGARGAHFALGRGARARLDCGAVTFLVTSIDRAPAVAAAAFDWRAPEHRYHLASVLGSARVESCIVQAVRRWEFPKPEGGGLVMVSYPFVLTPAGGAD